VGAEGLTAKSLTAKNGGFRRGQMAGCKSADASCQARSIKGLAPVRRGGHY
jgi:hypothetical protein